MQKKSSISLFVLPVLFILLVFWLGYTFYQAYQPQPERLQGQIEAQEYSVSSKIACITLN